MKEIIICSFLILTTSAAFAVEILSKFGLDLPGSGKITTPQASVGKIVGTGLGISIEVSEKVGAMFEFGGGLELQFPRKVQKYKISGRETTPNGNPQFSFAPIYVLAKVNYTFKRVSLFGKSQFGYNTAFNANKDYKGENTLSGDLHYGIGGGVVIGESVVIELLHSIYKGKAKSGDVTSDIDYSKIGFSVGYKFKL